MKWPDGAYEFVPGAWYVPHGPTQAGPFARPEEYVEWVKRVEQRDANLAEADRVLNATMHEGRFPAVNFVLGPQQGAEAAFIYAASRIYHTKEAAAGRYNADMFSDCGLFSGSHDDISRLINYGEQEQIYTHQSYQQTVDSFPDTPLKEAVMTVLA